MRGYVARRCALSSTNRSREGHDVILQQLTLRDFGLFKGRQVLNLAPAASRNGSQPIVLFGGVNGAGKTTILDAIQLVLYGVRARCSKRSNLPYEEFLTQSIHRGAEPASGAEILLLFRTVADERDAFFEVRRSWHLREGRLKEILSVFRDGVYDAWYSDNWAQQVEELVPLEISQLFFFDAEKIRSLTQDGTSSQALGAAIKSLLGLDIVERLIADVAVIQARQAKDSGLRGHGEKVEALEKQRDELTQRMDRLKTERSSLDNYLQRAWAAQETAEMKFRAAGGTFWQQRQEREEKKKEVETRLEEVETQLQGLSAGELPLALVPDLLRQVEHQDAQERLASQAATVGELLTERDDRLLEALQRARVGAKAIELVRGHLAGDRRERASALGTEPRLGLSQRAHVLLHHLNTHRLDELRGQVGGLLATYAQLRHTLDELERGIAAAPDDEEIGKVVQEFKTAAEVLSTRKGEAERLDAAISELKSERAECIARLEKLFEADVGQEFDREDRQRIMQLAARTRTTMHEFLRRATERKIDRLSGLISESFRFLLRKQSMVERILIDPKTFAITLYDRVGQALAKERLSEGEKQIFAIAVLWGLARASNRPLPAVIDTPMARLDATHRRNLVERYFPNASHQVVILSTDTEVDRDYYQILAPHVARAYHLNYDEEHRVTVAEEGYFWKAQAPAHPQEVGAEP
jgi:DNA sulfur modification protein DndD